MKANISNDPCRTDGFIDAGIELTPVTGATGLWTSFIVDWHNRDFPLVRRDESIQMDEFENPVYVHGRACESVRTGCNNCDARFAVGPERSSLICLLFNGRQRNG